MIEGKVSVLDRADVDTDQIIPKQFLKRIERTGFGEFLFYDWLRDGEIELEPNPILVAGRNFGCGSSREHAVVGARGVRLRGRHRAVVLATSSSPTARRTACCRWSSATRSAGRSPRPARRGSTSTIRPSPAPAACSASRSTSEIKRRLLDGLDDIAVTLQDEAAIDAFEAAGKADRGPVTTARL